MYQQKELKVCSHLCSQICKMWTVSSPSSVYCSNEKIYVSKFFARLNRKLRTSQWLVWIYVKASVWFFFHLLYFNIREFKMNCVRSFSTPHWCYRCFSFVFTFFFIYSQNIMISNINQNNLIIQVGYGDIPISYLL